MSATADQTQKTIDMLSSIDEGIDMVCTNLHGINMSLAALSAELQPIATLTAAVQSLSDKLNLINITLQQLVAAEIGSKK
jgi:hypothetical protein